jgi:hypothetical protein
MDTGDFATKCSFSLDGHVFAVFDNIINAINRFAAGRFHVDLIKEDIRRSKFSTPTFDDSTFGPVFEFCLKKSLL